MRHLDYLDYDVILSASCHLSFKVVSQHSLFHCRRFKGTSRGNVFALQDSNLVTNIYQKHLRVFHLFLAIFVFFLSYCHFIERTVLPVHFAKVMATYSQSLCFFTG